MADKTKARPPQLIRTDDSTPGVVKFYDRRVADVKLAFIGQVDVKTLTDEARNRAAVHGVSQNILDSSNKLDGDARVKFIKEACAQSQSGGWVSTPVDNAKLLENAISGITKLNLPAAIRDQMIASIRKEYATKK